MSYDSEENLTIAEKQNRVIVAGQVEQRRANSESIEALKAIARNTQTSRFAGIGQVTVTSAVGQMFAFRCEHGALFKAHNGNDALVYISNREGLLAAGGKDLGGFELGAGQAVWVPLRFLEDYYHLTESQSDQLISVWAV